VGVLLLIVAYSQKSKANGVGNYLISTDKICLDVDLIVDYLKNRSYWARGRTENVIHKSIDNSFCFGVYHEGEQIGFARVVTDFVVFAWIMDVFILENYRRKGIGQLLIQEIISHPQLKTVIRWGLGTEDAHDLYKKFGFTALSKPEMMMERIVQKDP
jgi:GNAT superfamily N-acetyltransferase